MRELAACRMRFGAPQIIPRQLARLLLIQQESLTYVRGSLRKTARPLLFHSCGVLAARLALGELNSARTKWHVRDPIARDENFFYCSPRIELGNCKKILRARRRHLAPGWSSGLTPARKCRETDLGSHPRWTGWPTVLTQAQGERRGPWPRSRVETAHARNASRAPEAADLNRPRPGRWLAASSRSYVSGSNRSGQHG
jgi:hypothetical protein